VVGTVKIATQAPHDRGTLREFDRDDQFAISARRGVPQRIGIVGGEADVDLRLRQFIAYAVRLAFNWEDSTS